MTAKVHNAVPPLIEGDIFTSLFEGATGWKVGACQADDAKAALRRGLTTSRSPCPDARPKNRRNWTDTLVLVNTPQGWKVDDVVYDADFAFGNTGRLSDMLEMVVARSEAASVTFAAAERIGEERKHHDRQTTKNLTPEQHRVLREHGTERPGSSPLNYEKRPGEFQCAGCGAELFDAKTKYRKRLGLAQLL